MDVLLEPDKLVCTFAFEKKPNFISALLRILVAVDEDDRSLEKGIDRVRPRLRVVLIVHVWCWTCFHGNG